MKARQSSNLSTEKSIKFVKEGYKSHHQKSEGPGIFYSASYWVIRADFSDSFEFPAFIALTTLRPNIVCFSKLTKKVVLIELTCPKEENFNERHNFKTDKYALVRKIRDDDWRVDFFAVELGLRSYCSKSVVLCLRSLGLTSKVSNSSAKNLGWTSLKASFVIWLGRNSKEWSNPPKVGFDRTSS